jgi:hypothetical protein
MALRQPGAHAQGGATAWFQVFACAAQCHVVRGLVLKVVCATGLRTYPSGVVVWGVKHGRTCCSSRLCDILVSIRGKQQPGSAALRGTHPAAERSAVST